MVLEIGGDLGALIVHTAPAMHGIEIEISPAADDNARSHKQVLERLAGGHPAYTAVFDGLGSGRYTLWSNGVARIRGVEIRAGEIAQLDWPRATAAPAA